MCLCKTYCKGKDAVVNDETKATTEFSKEEYRQQIPGPLPVEKPWESTDQKPERKGINRGNSIDSTGSVKKKKTVFMTRDNHQPCMDKKNCFENMEYMILPSSGKDIYKDHEKSDTDKNKDIPKQHHTGTSTVKNKIDSDRGAPESERETDNYRLSLLSETLSVRTDATKDDRMKHYSPLSEPQATSSPLVAGALDRKEITQTPPPSPEPTTKYTMDPHGEFI